MNRNELVKQLTFSLNNMTKSIAQLTKESQKGARLMEEILAFVTMLYLLASLVATVFSSNLVGTASNRDFVVAKQFRVHSVLTTALTVFIITPALAWQHLSAKKVWCN
ncbi:hypothetical protein FN846DRAFT_924122 [Sphaerosporella brunnea]|uniref:Uncharacterized protein n=1 Tax=Sphaerosporella brunnea TaxID=1250544 RepID=A0A5J5EC96_9PEZI|nr:hypothetical protein FN846DRAFT_924122 [Sphaerosporella brunnea]